MLLTTIIKKKLFTYYEGKIDNLNLNIKENSAVINVK